MKLVQLPKIIFLSKLKFPILNPLADKNCAIITWKVIKIITCWNNFHLLLSFISKCFHLHQTSCLLKLFSSIQYFVKTPDGQQYNLIVESKGFILHFLFHWGSLAQVWDNNSLVFYSKGNLKLVFILTHSDHRTKIDVNFLEEKTHLPSPC